MRMIRPGIHMQVPEKGASQPILWQHPFDRLLNNCSRFFGKQLLWCTLALASGVSGMTDVLLVGKLVAGQFDQFFAVFNMAGWIIGGFSILVGGFGIANIMFVSVKERTKIIGIQKSIGAKRYFILLQFIFEAIVLSVIGGSVGLVLIFLGTQIVSYATEFTIVLTAGL